MKIAILGWGSLIWNPENLNYDTDFNWSANGPILPIEFSRVSKDGRLTLVITNQGVAAVQTLYSISNSKDLDEAIQNLRERENTIAKNIGFYNKIVNQFFPNDFNYKQNILDWINKEEIDAVIWTNLTENWKDKIDNRIEYLKSLTGESQILTKNYIIKAPKQIRTKLRQEIENELGWM